MLAASGRPELSADSARLSCNWLVGYRCRHHTDQPSPRVPSLWVFSAGLRLIVDHHGNVAVHRRSQVDRVVLSPEGETRAPALINSDPDLAK